MTSHCIGRTSNETPEDTVSKHLVKPCGNPHPHEQHYWTWRRRPRWLLVPYPCVCRSGVGQREDLRKAVARLPGNPFSSPSEKYVPIDPVQ